MFQVNQRFLLWVLTALGRMPLSLATWVDCGAMDYAAFTASRGLASAQQALCVPVTFPLPFNCSGSGAVDGAAFVCSHLD